MGTVGIPLRPTVPNISTVPPFNILEEILSSKTGFWLILFLFKKSTFCSKSVLIDQKEYFLLKKCTFFQKIPILAKNSLFWSKNPYFDQKIPILVKKSLF